MVGPGDHRLACKALLSAEWSHVLAQNSEGLENPMFKPGLMSYYKSIFGIICSHLLLFIIRNTTLSPPPLTFSTRMPHHKPHFSTSLAARWGVRLSCSQWGWQRASWMKPLSHLLPKWNCLIFTSSLSPFLGLELGRCVAGPALPKMRCHCRMAEQERRRRDPWETLWSKATNATHQLCTVMWERNKLTSILFEPQNFESSLICRFSLSKIYFASDLNKLIVNKILGVMLKHTI